MAGYMIVGMFDCPWFAKAGLLVEYLTGRDPTRKFTLETLDSFQWQEFVEELRRSRGWTIKSSPVVWEILIDRDGKGNLIGDIDDFCEYVNLVFGASPHISTHEIEEAVCKNKARFGREGPAGHRHIGNAKVVNMAILCPPIKQLELILTQLLSFYPITDPGSILNIRVFDNGSSTPKELQGLIMEVYDMASPFLYKIQVTYTAKQCMYDAHIVLMMEDMSQGVEESEHKWLTRVEQSASRYAEALEDVCGKDCIVLVGCQGPQCFIAEVIGKKISREKVREGCIAATGQHVVNRAKSEISRRADIPSGSISRLHAWGWPGMTGAFVEIKDAVVLDTCRAIQGPTTVYRPLSELATNPNWVYYKFPSEFLELQKKGLASTKKMYSDMCIAEAIISTLHVWLESCRITPNTRIKCPTKCVQPDAGIVVVDDVEEEDEPTVSLPVISVGIPCKENSGLPPGTFVVQPAMCFAARWIPTGKISDGTNEQKELAKLWTVRQKLIFKEDELSRRSPVNFKGMGRYGEDDGEDFGTEMEDDE